MRGGQSALPVAEEEPVARLLAGALVQGCALPSTCPDDGLDPTGCVADPLPYTATELDGELVAVSVDEAAVASLALAPGSYWTGFGDGVSCERIVATFVVTGDAP